MSLYSGAAFLFTIGRKIYHQVVQFFNKMTQYYYKFVLILQDGSVLTKCLATVGKSMHF